MGECPSQRYMGRGRAGRGPASFKAHWCCQGALRVQGVARRSAWLKSREGGQRQGQGTAQGQGTGGPEGQGLYSKRDEKPSEVTEQQPACLML